MKSCVLTTLMALAVSNAMAADYKAPRLGDGSPDLQGVWTNATQTPLERSAELGTRRALTRAEAEAIEKKARGAVAADALPSDPDKKIEAGDLPPVGNYNLFWTDRGMTAAEIGGEYRSSIIIDPPNGRIPVLDSTDQRRAMARFRGESMADGPEQRPLGERCLLSFGSSAGPPMLPTMYNSYYQIVQSKDVVMILVEMVHDVRMIRIGGQHPPSHVRKWMGDSIGHWEGDTLVVETTNFRPDQNFRGSSQDMVVTERFTRVADDAILYNFTIRDPKTFASTFTGELPFLKADVNIYEYACHEGNYALPGILAAEREKEKAEAAAAKQR
jgi:hypothetical protein